MMMNRPYQLNLGNRATVTECTVSGDFASVSDERDVIVARVAYGKEMKGGALWCKSVPELWRLANYRVSSASGSNVILVPA